MGKVIPFQASNILRVEESVTSEFRHNYVESPPTTINGEENAPF